MGGLSEMDKGTNTERLGKTSKRREPSKKKGKGGRPKVNRDLVIQYLKAKDSLGNNLYTRQQIAKMAKCDRKTVGRIYNEAVESGAIDPDEQTKAIGIVEADFDAECQRAKGYSFYDWLTTRFDDESSATTVFNFSSLIWENLWDRCDLAQMRDDNLPLGDQMAIKFVTEFQEDKPRMRRRLKNIRFIFRFLGRQDICDQHLKMDNLKHPRPKRKLPEISSTQFPLIWNQIEDEVRARIGEEAVHDLRLKIVTQMRTGNKKAEREFYGIRKGTEAKSYLHMTSVDEYQFHVFAKKGEEWDVLWMPESVREALWEKYERTKFGESIARTPVQKLRDTFGDVTEEILGRRFILHDLRKISLTWLYVMGVPLEVATQMNVGWKDLSTAFDHYIDVKKILRKSIRAEYRENIPEWFKEGLDDFTHFEAVIDQRPGLGSAQGAIQGTSHFGR